MKIWMKSVDMICVHTKDGKITPQKFRVIDQRGETHIISIEKIMDHKEERIGGNNVQIFKVQSQAFGSLRVYEMKYELATCKWYIYKM